VEKPETYQAYLVRLWPTRRGGVPDYRVTVQSVGSGECEHFADLAGLLAFWQTLRTSPGARGVADDSRKCEDRV
jgi:hypothetical protein